MHFAASKDLFLERRVRRQSAGVRVHVLKGGKTLQVEGGSLCIVKADALIIPLPPKIRVVSEEGEEITPTWGFWVSTETFDPYFLASWRASRPRARPTSSHRHGAGAARPRALGWHLLLDFDSKR